MIFTNENYRHKVILTSKSIATTLRKNINKYLTQMKYYEINTICKIHTLLPSCKQMCTWRLVTLYSVKISSKY